MSLSLTTVACWIAGPAVSVFLVEHVLKKYEIAYKPSWAIGVVADLLVDFWGWLGRWAARLSSFLTYFELKDLWETFSDLARPTGRFFLSWLEFFAAYGKQAGLAIYRSPYTIYTGSALLVAGISFLVYRYGICGQCYDYVRGAAGYLWTRVYG